MAHWLTALGLSVGIGFGPPALAGPITLDGLTFSDELGGLELKQGWGSGTLDDPFVLVEEITTEGPAILTIRGMSHRFGNRIRSHHDVGFALTKIVRNRTREPWLMFNLELREFLDLESPFGDGLSFGQASEAGRPFRSDRFAETLEIREPYDGLQFFNGVIEPDETVTMSFVVTDTTPRWEFFLLQKRDSPVAGNPGPSTAALAGAGPGRDESVAVARRQRSDHARPPVPGAQLRHLASPKAPAGKNEWSDQLF